MFYILKHTALFRRYLLSFLFIIPLLLPSFLVTSHAPELLEQAQTLRHQQLSHTDHQHSHQPSHQHSHDDGFSSEQVAEHNHGHNSGDHQHGSIIVFDNPQLLINTHFDLNFNYLAFYYPPHLTPPEQPPKLLS